MFGENLTRLTKRFSDSYKRRPTRSAEICWIDWAWFYVCANTI